jgi:hypothetical protein
MVLSLALPVLPELQAALDAPPSGHMTFLSGSRAAVFLRWINFVSDSGKPYGLTSSQRRWWSFLGMDAGREPARAWRAYETHIARARWMTDTIFAMTYEQDGG